MTYLITSLKLIIFLSVSNNCTTTSAEPLKNVLDLRTSCLSNKTMDVFLPFNKGPDDSVIVLVSFKLIPPQCSVSIYTFSKSNLGVIIVMELFAEPKPKCERSIIIVQDDNATDVCKSHLSTTYTQVFLSNNVSILFNGKEKRSSLGDVKITATSARLSSNTACSEMNEFACYFRNQSFCINEKLRCDGNLNCGQAQKFDEDLELCSILQKNMWKLLLSAVTAVSTTVFLCYRFTKKYLRRDCVDFITENMGSTPVTKDQDDLRRNRTTNRSNLFDLDVLSKKSLVESEDVYQPHESSIRINDSQLQSSPKQLIFDELRVSYTADLQKKLLHPEVNEERNLKTLTYRRESGQPLKVTFYSTTTRL